MKTKHLVSAFIVMSLCLSACRDINVTTVVDNDGSFTRTITITGDSTDVIKTDLPYPVDTSWTMNIKKDTSDSTKYIAIYTKHFLNSEELNTEIRSDTGWMRQLVRYVDIRKKFRFFYSFIDYSEIYQAANPFTVLSWKDSIPKEDYLWATRQKEIQSPADSMKRKDAEEKVMRYLMESATAEIEKILADGITKLNDPRLDAKRVTAFHDSISAVLSKWDSKGQENFIDCYSRWTGEPAVLRLKELQPPLFAAFNKKTEHLAAMLMMEEFHIDAVMPGLITGTNSTVLKGNTVSWDVFPMAFLLEDYRMEAESRVVNAWAFIVSGLVLLSLVVLLVVRSVRK
jgi:hypothetical protein